MKNMLGNAFSSIYSSMKYGKEKLGDIPSSFFDLTSKTISGDQLSFSQYKGKLLLIVNIASLCGFTKENNKWLSDIAIKYQKKELIILAYPCGQFMNQEHSDTQQVCDSHMNGLRDCKECFNKSLFLMEKVDVNGDSAHVVYKYLRSHSKDLGGVDDLVSSSADANPTATNVKPIPWNYCKFLVDDGKVVGFFKSGELDQVTAAIDKHLKP